jgi:hypothetical protein
MEVESKRIDGPAAGQHSHAISFFLIHQHDLFSLWTTRVTLYPGNLTPILTPSLHTVYVRPGITP